MIFTGTIIAAASGSVGGLTFSRNRGGAYIRVRAVPIDPGSAEQIVVRNALTTLVTRWGDVLTPAQRDLWDIYATNVPVTNPLGNEIFLTGINHYTRSNVTRIQTGVGIVDDAPTVFNLGSFTPPTINIAPPLALSTAFDNTDAWANEVGGFMFVYGSRPQAPTINFFKGPYRFADTVIGDLTTPPTSPQIGTLPFAFATAQQGFFFSRVGRADGRLSSLLRTSATAP